MERVRNGGYPSNGIFLQDRGDLLKKKNCGSKKPKSPINTRDFEHGARILHFLGLTIFPAIYLFSSIFEILRATVC
jgi:hypothetical protein